MAGEVKSAEFETQTKPQIPPAGGLGMISAALGDGMELPKTSPGTIATYRKMRNNPTVALAMAVSTAPIRSAAIGVQARDDDTPDEWLELVRWQKRVHWDTLLKNMLTGVWFGFAPFENVYEVRDSLIVYKRIKHLIPEKTDILIDKETGEFKGFRQGSVELSRRKSFLYTHDQEGDQLHGRSRFENIRDTAWVTWDDMNKRWRQFALKVASVIALIHYPEGESKDRSGSLKDNFELAELVLANLVRGAGVAIPNTFAKYAGDLTRAGIDISKLKAWEIEFLETKGNHTEGFIKSMRYADSLIFRGILVPERAATEGQSGTKAEASAHGDLAMVIADLLMSEILAAANTNFVDNLLCINFGEDAAGAVRLVTEGVNPMTKAFFRNLIQAILSNPLNIGLLEQLVDVGELAESTGLPRPPEDPTGLSHKPGSNGKGGNVEILGNHVKLYQDIYGSH